MVFGTEGDICKALLVAIASHRDVQNTKVTYKNKQYPIKNHRLFGGQEFIEEGMSLAVYTSYSPYKLETGDISGSNSERTIIYKDRAAGSSFGRANEDYRVASTLRLIVQLYLRDATFNDAVDLQYEYIERDEYEDSPHGFLLQLKDGATREDLENALKSSNLVTSIGTLKVKAHPGEEILKIWTPIIRHVIRDIPVLLPYSARNPSIIAADYPTTNWTRSNQNLVFHTSYIVVEYDLYEPHLVSKFAFPKIDELVVTTSNS
jgi:hypothetical protein